MAESQGSIMLGEVAAHIAILEVASSRYERRAGCPLTGRWQSMVC
jgi:hypothetical protein